MPPWYDCSTVGNMIIASMLCTHPLTKMHVRIPEMCARYLHTQTGVVSASSSGRAFNHNQALRCVKYDVL